MMVPGCSYPALMLGRATKLQSSTSTRSRKSVAPRHVGTNSRATPWRAAGHSAGGIDAEKTVQKHPAALHSQLHFGPRRPSTAAPHTPPWQTTRAKNGIGREYPLPPGGRAGSSFGAEPRAQKKVLPPVGQQRARGQRGLPDTLIRARAGTHHRSPRTTPPARLASSSGMSCSWSPSQPGHVEPRHPGSPETAQRTEEKVAEGRHKRAQAAASSRDAKF